ncbi:cobyrinate a,c-diamide synthase [Asanoa sp. NPDC049518]|uniref:cobyrinate a,c-diamide synthase n=1 Tax=unclassified Asanoa TaxID=2685164 RepID=UPI00344022AD
MSAVPRVVVSAPSSGHGKTALAVGLLAAFAGRGLSAVGFKVGPDHTDAAYLGAAAGSPGRNLDPRLVGAHRVAPLFAHAAQGRDIAVVEGTMGLFDSLAGRVETDSTAGVAAALRAPVIMVVDVGAMGQSVAALVHGFRAYDELTWLGGVILNRVASDRHEQLLREALDDIGVPVYGALRRRDLPSTLPPRHEGVVPVLHREVEALRGIRRLGESVAGAVDLDGLLALAHSAPDLPATPWSPASELALAPDDTAAVMVGRRPVVALAGGQGLSFTYAETRELLEAAGATVVPVDPLRDELLPEGTDALIVGGALPEAYAEELSANRRLCADVADLARSGRPVIAEGAGLLWLAQSFDGRPMCGVLDATGSTGDQMIVGYRDATARATTAVAEVGARVVGYKQHRGVVNPRSGQTPAWTWNSGTPEGFVWRRVHASQLSLHWAGFPEIARRLVLSARPGDGPTPEGSWAQATGPVPVVGGALDYGTPTAESAPRLRAVPAGGSVVETTEASTSPGPPRLRVVPPLPEPDDGRGYDAAEQVTDGFGFAGVPGARAGEPMGDGYAYVMPGEQVPPDAGDPRRPGGAEFGFPVGRPAAGNRFGSPARRDDEPVPPGSAVPADGFGPRAMPGPASGVPAHGFADGGSPPFPGRGPGPMGSAGQPSAVPALDGDGFDQRPRLRAVSSIPAYDDEFGPGPGGGFGPASSEWSSGGIPPPVSPGQPPAGPARSGGFPDQPGLFPPPGGGHAPASPDETAPFPSPGVGYRPGSPDHAGAFPRPGGGHGPAPADLPGPFPPVGRGHGPAFADGAAPFPSPGDGYGPRSRDDAGTLLPPGGGHGPVSHDRPGPFPPPGSGHGSTSADQEGLFAPPSGHGPASADRPGPLPQPGSVHGSASADQARLFAPPSGHGPASADQPGPFPPPSRGHGPASADQAGPFRPTGGYQGQPSALSRGGHGSMQDGSGPAGVPHQPSGPGGRHPADGRPANQWGVAPVTGGQPVPGGGDQTLSGRAAADGALDGGTAEVPTVRVRAPQPPRQTGGGGRMRDEDGGIA